MDGAFSDPNAKATMLIGLIVLPVQHEKGTGVGEVRVVRGQSRREKARGIMRLELVCEQSPGRCISDASLVKSMEVDAYFRCILRNDTAVCTYKAHLHRTYLYARAECVCLRVQEQKPNWVAPPAVTTLKPSESNIVLPALCHQGV